MREDDAKHRTVGGDRNAIDDGVNRIAQIFKTRDERNIQLARGQSPAERRGMIKLDVARPTVDERAGVQVFDAAEAKRSAHFKRRPVRRALWRLAAWL